MNEGPRRPLRWWRRVSRAIKNTVCYEYAGIVYLVSTRGTTYICTHDIIRVFLWIDETRHQSAGTLPDARTDTSWLILSIHRYSLTTRNFERRSSMHPLLCSSVRTRVRSEIPLPGFKPSGYAPKILANFRKDLAPPAAITEERPLAY